MKTRERDGADLMWSAEAFTARKAAMRTARGYFAETVDGEAAANNGGAMATGTLYSASIGLTKGDLVTALDVAVQTVAAGLTLWKAALADRNGLALAVSAEQSALVTASIGKKPLPLLANYRVTDDDLYQVFMLSVGTTGPALRGGSGQTGSGIGAARTGFSTLYGVLNGQTDIVVGTTYVVAPSSAAQLAWAGLY